MPIQYCQIISLYIGILILISGGIMLALSILGVIFNQIINMFGAQKMFMRFIRYELTKNSNILENTTKQDKLPDIHEHWPGPPIRSIRMEENNSKI